MKNSLALRFAAVVALAFAMSCGHLSTPDYNPQGEYTPASQYFQSQGEYPSPNAYHKGPLRLVPPVKEMKLNRGFLTGRRKHRGIDIGGRKGDPIFAAHQGIVVYAGRGFRGYGNMVLLEFDEEWASLYGHLSKIKVKTGDIVGAGQVIGEMGRTGRASGVHLHFELMKNKIPVDPLPILESFKAAAWLNRIKDLFGS